ncbi:MAG TPA: alpha-1,4-glucan--maltose-1-phosphate maltosyltransferase [Candidatus Dormibacteraeota bacterium]|nr:alpha-1,4-glucan--maltose-1-phosphate maltosyltransferase [Candidatus Dormibacteraeota bacterium]
MSPSVAIEHVRPCVDGGAFAAKGTIGLPQEISADVFTTGHEAVRAWATLTPPPGHPKSGRARPPLDVPLQPTGNDHWVGDFTPDVVGCWQLSVGGIVDDYGTWLRDTRVKHEAGQDVALELEEGDGIVEGRGRATGVSARDRAALERLRDRLRHGSQAQRLRAAGSAAAVAALARTQPRDRAARAGPYPLWIDRGLGGFSAWYEMFPRSEGATEGRSGTFKTAAKRLKDIAAMGFDIVYLPPIHPIGESLRKGPNNSLTAGPDDPGSPWAIGGPAGGHDAVHPDLGTIRDFDAFVATARRQLLEVALDFAVQCSHDHPWVTEHPDWFQHRPDGSIRYAENPPKRYQDIYPIDFDTDDRDGLWRELDRVVRFWINHGVKVFRVDNPHTKSIDFWTWLIEGIHGDHPDVIFLAEAFTRPRVMERLAKVGFTQSYTYFTWRNTKHELSDYLRQLSQTEVVDYFRPNFWVNTPDILHETLQQGGPAAFRLRLVLAAITAPSWGMYSGYELYEDTPLREGSEEYLDSEKYQYRPRDWSRADSLAPMITRVNDIRRRHHEAIALLRTLRLHHVDSDQVLAVSRRPHGGGDALLLVCNLDPHNVVEATCWPDLDALGLGGTTKLKVHDELTGASYSWSSGGNYVRLDPKKTPAHIFSVHPAR